MAVRGISLLDLFAPFPGSQAIVPSDLAARLENLAVVEHRSTTATDAFIHSGVVQPVADLGFPALRNWPVEVPGLNTGLPFRLVRTRRAASPGQLLESPADTAFLDLIVDRIAITVPGLRPATLVPAAPATAAHLLRDDSRSDVRIVGSGVVRIDLSGSGEIARFVDTPDPFDPAAPTGAVFGITFDPVSFFFGDSEIGMVVDQLIFDASETTTPPAIIERGQTPGWQGISIAEATLLLPPNGSLVDKVSVGVRDVLLGSPIGLQGEIRVELGRTPINAQAVDFLQRFEETEHQRTPSGSGRKLEVPFVPGTPATAEMRAKLSPSALGGATQPGMDWTLPDGSRVDAGDTGWFPAAVGDRVVGRFSEEVDGDRVQDEPTTYTFTAADAGDRFAPEIVVHVGAVDIANVVAVSGSAQALHLLEFNAITAVPDSTGLRWAYGAGSNAPTSSGHDFVLDPGSEVGTRYLVLTDPEQRTRSVRVDVLAQGSLLIGAEDGVHDAAGALIDIRAVEQTYQLAPFHRQRQLQGSGRRATLTGGAVTVPDGALAAVTVEVGAGLEPEAPPGPITEDEVRHLSVRFGFNTADPEGWGVFAPRNPSGSIPTSITDWAAFFPGATFLVIGRCCDIGGDPQNATLATARVTTVIPWLPAGAVVSRGEQTAPSVSVTTAQDAVSPPLTGAEKAAGRLIEAEHDATERTGWGELTTHPIRESYRRVDVYAVGGTHTPPPGADPAGQQASTDPQTHDPALRRSLVPGADGVEPPKPDSPRLAYLIRLVVRWDSPTVTGWADAIPTQAEFTLEWATDQVTTMPDPAGTQTDLAVRAPSQPVGSTTTEVYQLIGRWSYDSRSGQTVFSLSIASSGDPQGLFAVDSTFLAVALALAPALLAGIGAAGVDGAAVRMAALAVATAVLTAVTKDGELIIHKAEAEYRGRSLGSAVGSRTRVLLDYTASVGFDIEADGLGSISTDDGHPLRVRYAGVGLEFDDGEDEWYDKFGLVYDDVSFEVADPGRWKIEGPLGDLLQVVGSRAGVGSSWFELDLEFALDLGVVSITGATVRAEFGDGGFTAELRGLGVSVEIPEVLRGEGRLVLGDGGAFKAAIELELDKLGVKAMGALAFDPAHDFLSIGLGLLLPVGIPLASSGLAIYGFLGQFVSNGARELPPGFTGDPVGREIAWYRDVPFEDKFAPRRGQWALGLGIIVGTLPDKAFTFNATGMLVVAFPDPAVILGIDAKLVQPPEVTPRTQGDDSDGPGLEILGLVAVDDEAVLVGVRGSYTIPKVLKLLLPIDGYFPYPSTAGDAFVRIGADGVDGRNGDPVTITLLPDTLDVAAYSYLMVEEKQLHNLGGNPDFSFDGFSVGFGAGFELEWSAGPLRLEAGASILVGLGTNPFLLKGGIFVKGSLDLGPVSVSARGEVVCTVWDDSGSTRINLDGRFCGKVSFFFFSVEGCVHVEIGDELTVDIPPPPAPIGKVTLTDRRGFITATASTGPPGLEQTVWPDTVPVIELTHHVALALPAGSAFDPGTGPAGPPWSGASELKYAYRITSVELTPGGGSPLSGPLDSAWWLPTQRPGVLAGGDVAVSAEEGMVLALLAWNPAPWSYWLNDGGAGTDGDPSTTPGRLCDPPVQPARSCLLGKRGTRTGLASVRFTETPAPATPLPSRFAVTARERAFGRDLDLLGPLLAERGLSLVPGQVGPGPFGEDVWWLAALTRFGFTRRVTELRGTISPEIAEPELVLVVCRDLRRRPGDRPPTECEEVGDHFVKPDLPVERDSALGPIRLELPEPSRTVLGPGQRIAIEIPSDGLTCVLPEPTSGVRVTLFQSVGRATLVAVDGNGTELTAVETGFETVADVVLTGPGIVAVRIGPPADGTNALARICRGVQQDDPEPDPRSDLPVVAGSPVAGGEVEWQPTIVDTVRTETSRCLLVSYRPREDAVWRRVRIREWSGTGKNDAGRVGLVRLCGVSAAGQLQADQNAEYVDSLVDLVNSHPANGADPRDLLAANTAYTVTIGWEWQGWVATDAQPEPPASPGTTGWTAGDAVAYRFRTAARAVTTGTPPAELTDERDFDPRALLRYLIAFDPSTGAAPHLLDDELLVHLAVDYADQLAALYARELGLRLRRTDPPPGTLAGQPHAPNVDLTVVWGPLHDALRPTGERRFLEAIREAPCLEEPALGGTTGAVLAADLVPGAWYDLMLMATPAGQPTAEDTVVARTHFQASRYRDVPAIVTALGFGVGEESPFLAGDAVLSAAGPPDQIVGSHDLDTTLATIGLDPWPLVESARTTVLWLPDGSDWLLGGLLLDLPEPLVRAGRTALDIASCQYGGVPLLWRRRSDSGTRVLLTPAAPTVVSASDGLFARPAVLTLAKTVTDRTGATTTTPTVGRRAALTVPRMIYAEAGA